MTADASDLYALSRDFGKTGPALARELYDTYRTAAADLRDEWKRNAKQTAGDHGRLYPESITAEMRVGLSIEAEIGPDPSRPQGGMSFEYGSVNQPPHLDGQLATDRMVPLIERRIDAVVDDVFGEVGL